jgi:flavodoxin/NAD-dependent dihydropyrimidine dehydrogenase PreA subunit
MKCLIIYFSLTGNTGKVARAIYEGIRDFVEECHIAMLKDVNPSDLVKYDLIGLGSPVHFYEPANVRHFIQRIGSIAGKHCFLFCTHATWPEAFFPSILEALQPTGLLIIGTGHWYGGQFDQQFPTPFLTDGHPDEIDLLEAKDFGRQMIERSRRIWAGETQLIPSLPVGRALGLQIAEHVLRQCVDDEKQTPSESKIQKAKQLIPRSFKSVAKLNMNKCSYPKCRLCMDNCPMDGIDLSISPPRFAEPCMNCLFCEKICPRGAIECDFEETVKICRWGTEEIYAPILARAEAEGRFRRLIPLDKVGWDTPYYKVFNQHPRFVIT